MAKRILAIVMALALSLTLLSAEMFAASSASPSLNYSDGTLTGQWNEVDDATKYVATIYNSKDQRVGQSKTVTVKEDTTSDDYRITYKTNVGGNYYLQVAVYKDTKLLATENSANRFVPSSSTSSSGVKITVTGSESDSTTVTWTGKSGVTKYYIEWTYTKEGETKTYTGNAEVTGSGSGDAKNFSYPVGVSYERLKTVKIYQGSTSDHESTTAGSWTNSGTSSGGSSSQSNYVVSDGLVSANGTVLTWSSYSSSIPASAYSIGYYYTSMNGQSTREATVAANSTYTYNVSSILSQFLTNYGYYGGTVTFTVYVSGSPIGSATYDLSYYAGYGSGYGYGSAILVTLTGYGTATVTWNAAAGAYSYAVVCNSQSQPVYGNTATVSFTYGSPAQITVYALNANGQISGIVGTAMISANGTVSYGNTTNLGGSVNGTTVNGNNCTLVVGSSSTSVSWNASYGAAYYTVVYLPQGGNARATSVYGTSTTIPVGSSESFDVTIIYNSSVIGSASYTAVSSNVTSSSTTNLTLTAKSSNYTTVSWSPVSGATFYQIDYYRTGANTNETTYTTATNVDVPFGKNVNWTVVVYAALSSGRMQTVGTATHKAGDDFPSTSTTTPTNPGSTTSSQYVTGLKGTTGNKKITLSWNAASGASSYEVWYKRSSNSSWKKLGSTSKRSVNVTDLLNGTSYDFKIVANGKDSGVLTITPSTGASTTKTAPDPTGAGTTTTTTTVPVITSIEGGTASFTVKWNGITNGTEYQVWVANGNSNEYSRKATVTATSATITGLSAGTYKVRIKGTTNGTYKTLKEGGGSDYVTVTVK